MSCDYFSLTHPGIQSLHPYQPGKPIEELERELQLKTAENAALDESYVRLKGFIDEQSKKLKNAEEKYGSPSCGTWESRSSWK